MGSTKLLLQGGRMSHCCLFFALLVVLVQGTASWTLMEWKEGDHIQLSSKMKLLMFNVQN